MLEEKDLKVIKDKACQEINKLCQKMMQTNDPTKADWESLVLALKAYEKALHIESMEMSGNSGYSGRGSMRSNDYSGGGSYYGSGTPYGGSYGSYGGSYGSYDMSRAMDEMMKHADPREREILERMSARYMR